MRRSRFAVVHAVVLGTLLLPLPSSVFAAPKTKPPLKKPAATPVATPEVPAAEPEPVHVKVGCYVLNIGKFDVTTGTYTIDFYLNLTSLPDKSVDMGDAKFEFMNGRAQSVDKLIDEPGEKFYRIQASLGSNVDMHRFPWDSHKLSIILEHGTRSKKEVIYEIDEKQSGIDPAVVFVGWNLKGYSTSVSDHVYEVYGETYSQYHYDVNIGRLIVTSTLKTFLPVFCFLLISLVSLLVTIDKLESRVGMNTAMLIASVLYHLSIASQLPPAGYLTVADKVMVATYATIGVNLLLSVRMMQMMQRGLPDRATRIRSVCFKLIPGFALSAYILCAMI